MTIHTEQSILTLEKRRVKKNETKNYTKDTYVYMSIIILMHSRTWIENMRNTNIKSCTGTDLKCMDAATPMLRAGLLFEELVVHHIAHDV